MNPVEDLKKAIEEIENSPRPTAEMEKESNKKHFGLYMTNDEVLDYWSKQRGESNV